jgi:hypothetical protein
MVHFNIVLSYFTLPLLSRILISAIYDSSHPSNSNRALLELLRGTPLTGFTNLVFYIRQSEYLSLLIPIIKYVDCHQSAAIIVIRTSH